MPTDRLAAADRIDARLRERIVTDPRAMHSTFVGVGFSFQRGIYAVTCCQR